VYQYHLQAHVTGTGGNMIPGHRLRILNPFDLHERVEPPWKNDERKAEIRLGEASRRRVPGDGFPSTLQEIRKGDAVDFA